MCTARGSALSRLNGSKVLPCAPALALTRRLSAPKGWKLLKLAGSRPEPVNNTHSSGPTTLQTSTALGGVDALERAPAAARLMRILPDARMTAGAHPILAALASQP